MKLAVSYRGEDSLTEIKYAGDLADRANCELSILIDSFYRHKSLIDLSVDRVSNYIIDMIGPGVKFVVGCDHANLGFERDGHTDVSQIIVSNSFIKEAKRATVIAPGHEAFLYGRSRGEVMFPIGKRGSGRWAIDEGLSLLKKISPDAKILIWHTTWPKTNLTSTNPADHVCDMSRSNIEYAERKAHEMRFETRTLIEMRREVVEGLSRALLREGCSMVVMTKGVNTKWGNYPIQLIERSCPVPLMLIRPEVR